MYLSTLCFALFRFTTKLDDSDLKSFNSDKKLFLRIKMKDFESKSFKFTIKKEDSDLELLK